MNRPSVPAVALLPLRVFFGLTFLWAGLDKLLDPTFFDAAAATSIESQLVAFARLSPLGDLIRSALPLAAPIGLVIAIGEIGVGIGALTGIAFRVAAGGGFLLSVLLWLTASFATHPYYVGADLPYAVGWLTLAIAGHGGLLVVATRPPPMTVGDEVSPGRRLLLQTGTLAALAAIAASITAPLRAMGLTSEAPAPTPSPSPAPSPGGSPSPGPTAGPVGSVELEIAKVSDVRRAGSVAFTIPFDAPAPLPAGDPGVVIQLADQSLVAFDAVCTHAGCTVEYERADALLVCPCHGATFDPARGAAVLDGPTRTPLTRLPLVIDEATGTIRLSVS